MQIAFGEAAIKYHRPHVLRELLCANLNEELRALFGSEEAVPVALAKPLQSFCKQPDQNVSSCE